MSAEQAVRRRVADVLRGDGALMALVHQVYEAYAPRMHMPYVRLDGAEGREWGTKEREGREVVVTMSLVAAQGQAQGGGAAMEAALADLRGDVDGWQIAASHIMRSRWSEKADGHWQQQLVLRCRCFRLIA